MGGYWGAATGRRVVGAMGDDDSTTASEVHSRTGKEPGSEMESFIGVASEGWSGAVCATTRPQGLPCILNSALLQFRRWFQAHHNLLLGPVVEQLLPLHSHLNPFT